MEEVLRFCRAAEVWIYLLLGLVGVYFIRRFGDAWQELRGAAFGLERERAQGRLNQSASALVVLLAMVVTEFILVSFIAPAVPGAMPLPTPTLDLLATPTTTLPVTTLQAGEENVVTEAPPVEFTFENACLPGQVEITSPQNGEEVSGVVEVIGSADIPNFGFYKFEIKRPEDSVWLTIQAGNLTVQNGKLGDWDTTQLLPGEYQLGLVVVDNQAQATAPCVIQMRVARIEGTPNP